MPSTSGTTGAVATAATGMIAAVSKSDDGNAAAELVVEICHEDRAVALASKRELWRTVRLAGRPDAQKDKSELVAELIACLARDLPLATRRELLWMLSEIGGDESVGPIAALLAHKALRDDARMVLQRIPGDKSLAALEAGLAAAPEDFKINVAQSLRSRGVMVPGHPCRKLVPTKPTAVKAIG